MGNSGPRLRHTAHGDQRRDGTHVRKETRIYLAQLDHNIIDKANRKIIDLQ